MLNVEILGGVGEYGRNCFYLEKDGRAILLDCGVMNNREKTMPTLTPAHVAKLDAVFISHSHIDHVGALPLLEQWGYNGQLIMSEMTAKQLKHAYPNIQTFSPESIGYWLHINQHLSFQWGFSGHLIGSVWYSIRFLGEVIFFSGDYVLDSYLLKANLPYEDCGKYNVAFIDSGHVEKTIKNEEVLQQIVEFICTNASRPIIFPSSFSGKTADIAIYLLRIVQEKCVLIISCSHCLKITMQHLKMWYLLRYCRCLEVNVYKRRLWRRMQFILFQSERKQQYRNYSKIVHQQLLSLQDI
ncbi:Ribonuclease J [Lysinibacillus sphaericus]